MKELIRFIATGDSFITRRVPSWNMQSFRQIASYIQQSEVRFTNLEVSTRNYEGFPSAFSGGTWASAQPKVLSDLKRYGFNLIAWANNHTLDYSYGGLAATNKYLNKYEFVHAGVGKNLSEASAPKYLECPSGRVALIAATSTFHQCWLAGEQFSDMVGRPGINPLRYNTTYLLPMEQFDCFKAVVNDIGLPMFNSSGHVAEDAFMFGNYRFAKGKQTGITSTPLENDIKRIHRSIKEAERRADYVLVSIHSHETGADLFQPADFLKKFARSCIDAGAHAVLGHGPHILKPIEIYKNRPIFYSLGNFIFQNETVSHLPWDFYERYGLNYEANVADALDQRRKQSSEFDCFSFIWKSVIAFWSMEMGKLKELKLYPIELGFGLPTYRRGWPEPSQSTEILEALKTISAPYGTRIKIEGLLGEVSL